MGLDKKVYFELFYWLFYKYNNDKIIIRLKKKYENFKKTLLRFGFRLEKTYIDK